MSYSLWPLELARLLCPWASPGKNTGVDCHVLLQGHGSFSFHRVGFLLYHPILCVGIFSGGTAFRVTDGCGWPWEAEAPAGGLAKSFSLCSLFRAVCSGFSAFPLNKTHSPAAVSANQALSKPGASGLRRYLMGSAFSSSLYFISLQLWAPPRRDLSSSVLFCEGQSSPGISSHVGVNVKPGRLHVDGRPQTLAWHGG